jgi:hypothetical protein
MPGLAHTISARSGPAAWRLPDLRALLANANIREPYNVSYEGYTEDRLTIQGDRMNERCSTAAGRETLSRISSEDPVAP